MIKPHKTGLSLIRTPLFWWRSVPDMVRYRTLLSCNKLQLLEPPPSNQADLWYRWSESVGTLSQQNIKDQRAVSCHKHANYTLNGRHSTHRGSPGPFNPSFKQVKICRLWCCRRGPALLYHPLRPNDMSSLIPLAYAFPYLLSTTLCYSNRWPLQRKIVLNSKL